MKVSSIIFLLGCLYMGFILGVAGITYTMPIFYAILVPVCAIGSVAKGFFEREIRAEYGE